MREYFASSADVAKCLLTYTDWWQPPTSSVIQVGAARRRKAMIDGIHDGLIGALDERSELCRRLQQLQAVDREVLYLWYVRQLAVDDIARHLRISRRQCFRRRTTALRRIVELGETGRVA